MAFISKTKGVLWCKKNSKVEKKKFKINGKVYIVERRYFKKEKFYLYHSESGFNNTGKLLIMSHKV